MPRLPPDHVGLRVADAARTTDEPPTDHPIEMAFFYLVKLGHTTLPDVDEAAAIYGTETQRHVLDAAILAKADDETLLREIDVPRSVAMAYRHLFFDRGVFRHDLDAQEYGLRPELPEDVRAIYQVALQQGADVLLAKYHVGPRSPIDPKEVIRSTLAAFYERSQAHRGQDLTSELARAALQWGRAAVDTAATLIDKGNNQAEAALKDLRLTLEIRDHTHRAEDVGVRPDEVLGRD